MEGDYLYTYKTIIFDLDGTLFKSDKLFFHALQKVCEKRKVTCPDVETIIRLIGSPMVEICGHVFGKDLTKEQIAEIRAEVRREETEILTTYGEVYPGAREMLNTLKERGYNLCLCSYGSGEYVDNVLSSFELKDYFTVVKSRVEGLSKSQLIKQIQDETSSSTAVVVGDTHFDTDAAKDTKCLSIGVSYGYGTDFDSDFTADNPEDVLLLIDKINSFYRTIASGIVAKKQHNNPLIVGINGVDTSGKTRFSKELHTYLVSLGYKVEHIHLDDFHNPSKIRNQGPNPIDSYINNAFDLHKLVKEILSPIKDEGKINKKLNLLDLAEDQYSKEVCFSVDSETIVLVEGVLLYREPITKYFDYKIFLDIDFDEVLKRATQRDFAILGDSVTTRYKEKYIPIQKRYIAENNPTEIADVIIDNRCYKSPKITKYDIDKVRAQSNIVLKPMSKKYLDNVVTLLEDHEVKEMIGVVYKPTLSNFVGKNTKSYAILGQREEFLGIVEVFNISWKNRRGELSIALSPLARGKGYSILAMEEILDIAFGELGLNRLWLRVLENNHRAINLYQKVGFVREGLCREESIRNGRFVSQIQMSILNREWQKNCTNINI